ncbi:TonB-dependent receptor [Desertivirga arenae]|uniref:TonB-dependent receptor n=1 Tax=Desertivirga arenae TaxID=2810309 RepID=UPI001A97704D|nr:TonB-dependent receptor [Pedobacter sp. SYSU D00823]
MQFKRVLLLGALCTCALTNNLNAGEKKTSLYSMAYEKNLPEEEQQYGVVRGKIKTSDGNAASYVSVKLKGTKFGAISNEKGEYQIKRVPAGDYTLVVSGVGLVSKEKQIAVSPKGIVMADFTLDEDHSQLAEVQITSRKNKFKEDKVSSSLRLQSPLIEVPQNIKVVNQKLIADQLVFDVVDGVTRNVSGTIRTGHWDAQYANISTRGTTIPAFRNGMNMKMPWGPLTEDAATIERIEFVKGPSGFMMANGEPGGIYNIVTKKPTGQNRSSVTLSGGGYGLGRAAIDLDGKLSRDGRLLFRLNAAAQTKGSYNKFNYTDKYVIAPVLSYQLDSNTLITAEYTTQRVEAQALGTYGFSPKGLGATDPSFFIGDPTLDPNKLFDHNATFYFSHNLNKTWKVNSQVAYVKYGLAGGTPWPSTIAENGDMKRYLNISEELAINKNAQLSIMGDVETGSVIHRIMTGVDYGNLKTWGDFASTRVADLQLTGDAIFNIYNPVYGSLANPPSFDRSKSIKIRSALAANLPYLTNLTYTGAYLQDEIRMIDEKLRLTLAGRYTHAVTVGKSNATQISDNAFSPRVGLSYSITKNFSAYTLYDQSFLPQSGQDIEGNIFKPVEGNNIEFGVKKDWFDGKWNAVAAIYQITKENVLTSDPRSGQLIDPNNPSAGVYGNYSIQTGQQQFKGVELDISGEITRGLNVVLNYAYTDARVSKDTRADYIKRHTPNSVDHITNGWLSYRYTKQGSVLDGFGLTGGYQIQLGRHAGTIAAPLALPDYYRFDAGASYERGKFSISCLVNNLLDRRLLTQGSFTNVANPTATSVSYYTYIYEVPRNARVSVSYRFK